MYTSSACGFQSDLNHPVKRFMWVHVLLGAVGFIAGIFAHIA